MLLLSLQISLAKVLLAPDGLFATTQLARLDPSSGAIFMPSTTRYTLIEVGCSDWGTLDETVLDKHAHGFLISFEPMLDKFAVLMARGTTRYHGPQHDMAVPIGHHHRRGVVLPLAVSPQGGPLNFTVHRRAGCSSLLNANATATSTWGRRCQHVLEHRRVESISLAQAIALAGPLPVRHLKTDAQGVDFKLIKALEQQHPGLLFRRVLSVQMETRTAQCTPLYEGQETCNEVLAYMRRLGYSSNHNCPSPMNTEWCERTMQFYHKRFGSFAAVLESSGSGSGVSASQSSSRAARAADGRSRPSDHRTSSQAQAAGQYRRAARTPSK